MKIETAFQREEKIKDIATKIMRFPNHNPLLLADFETALIAYRNHEMPWQSQLIEVVKRIDGVRFRVKAISTHNTILDKALELYGQVVI